MSVRLLWIAVLALATPAVGRAGAYCGAAGTTGSTAIYKDDAAFVEWASGYRDYAVGANCSSSWQTPAKALDKAVGDSYDIVCLGDGGQITMTFDRAVANGDGYDFAVFENGFSNTFLELAYVEVSSDGTNFFRFDNDSQTASPVGGFGSVDPTNIDGLAGKYRQGYGTPFDLEGLAGASPLLDVDNVAYVRIVDIIGDGAYTDTSGDVIYDPYPCSGSAGFDLDAVGVIHAVPEPGVWALLVVAGLAAIVVFRGKLRRRPAGESSISYNQKPDSSRSACDMSSATFSRHVRSITRHANAACLLALGVFAGVCQGTVVDFEDLGQGPDAFEIDGTVYGYYWDGADGAGEFTSGGTTFNNANSGWWSGFTYSDVNYTDTSVSDYTHQYAAVTGTDPDGAGNYAIGYGYGDMEAFGGVLPTVTIPDGLQVQSAVFTNTTYAAASMLNGDGFARQFTSSDWFLLTITGEDAADNVVGTVDFYLAQNGSIVTDWQSVDLGPLATAKTLTFDLTSSDTGVYGMNTPAYFAMDNLTLSAVPEPSTLALFGGAGVVAAACCAKWRLRLCRAAPDGEKCGPGC